MAITLQKVLARIDTVTAATEMVSGLGKLLIGKLGFGKARMRRGGLDQATIKFDKPPTEAAFVKAMEKLKGKKAKGGAYRVLFPEEDNLQLIVKRLDDGSLSIDAN